jgi:hypothetical protein
MNRGRRAQILLLGALVLGCVLYLNLRGEAPRSQAEPAAEREPTSAVTRRLTDAKLSRVEFARLLLATQETQPQTAVADAHTNHPHPITSDHVRLYHDVDLLHAADEAIKSGELDRARDLLSQHHRELHGMSVVEEEGLFLLADCVEEPNESNVARVKIFYEDHPESTVRRRLRRGCLELASLRP